MLITRNGYQHDIDRSQLIHSSNPIHGYILSHTGGFEPTMVRLVLASSMEDAIDEYLCQDEPIREGGQSVQDAYTIDDLSDYNPESVTWNDNGIPVDTDWLHAIAL